MDGSARPEPGWQRARIGEVVFDRLTGELERDGVIERLAPQPAELLALLVDQRGEVATRDQIRAALWPDVAVDFDGSLHHCVRQLRAGLGDDAKDPRFVETVPRRGYRLRCAIELEQGPSPSPSRRRWIAVGAAVAVAAAVGALGWRRSASRPEPPLAVAIAGFDGVADRLGELILIELTGVGPGLAVIGPRTTGPLVASGRSLREIGEATGADVLINARPIGGEILIEVIRQRDGSHVWVKRFVTGGDEQAVAAAVTEVVVAIARDGS